MGFFFIEAESSDFGDELPQVSRSRVSNEQSSDWKIDDGERNTFAYTNDGLGVNPDI